MIIDKQLEDKVRSLCERLNISSVFDFVSINNPSNNLPYHNWYHALCMVEKCVEGGNYHNLPYHSLRHLAVAALFHDFAHSGGKEEDLVNISLAKMSLQRLADQSVDATISPGIDVREVKEIIAVTEYPYVLDPICIEQKIIRDADLMQAFRPTWKEMIIDGLREEMIIKLNKNLTEKDMLEGQVAFLKKVHPCSAWGKYVMFDCGQLDIAILNITGLI